MMKPNFKLVAENQELLIAVNERSWHVLDHSHFLSEGWILRKAFGMDFVAGLGKKPQDGILNSMRALKFQLTCKDMWSLLVRDKDLLSYAYSYEFEREKGVKHGGGISGFKVRGFCGYVSVRPTGYCTLKLSEISPSGIGRTVEIIDLRVIRQIQTDDWGYLKVHRRKMEIDWYREMPRILEFCANKKGDIQIFEI
jgi:hypothetical protein